jgi:MFS family permease
VFFSGRLSDKLGRRKPLVMVASLLMAMAMLAPMIPPTLPAMFVQAILTGLLFGI